MTDQVDLSQTAKLAADYQQNAGSGGKNRADQLASSLKEARTVTDAFAKQLRAGRPATASLTDFNDMVRQEVAGILSEGKPANLFDRIVRRLFG